MSSRQKRMRVEVIAVLDDKLGEPSFQDEDPLAWWILEVIAGTEIADEIAREILETVDRDEPWAIPDSTYERLQESVRDRIGGES